VISVDSEGCLPHDARDTGFCIQISNTYFVLIFKNVNASKHFTVFFVQIVSCPAFHRFLPLLKGLRVHVPTSTYFESSVPSPFPPLSQKLVTPFLF
jgi:hypothetical protein